MNRKIIMSLMSTVGALAIMGGSAFAAFVVNATSNGSTFSSGNPSLALCNDTGSTTVPGACANQIPSPISVADLIPGTSQTFAFWIQNNGTDSLTPLKVTFNNPTGTGHGISNVLETDLDVQVACDATSGSGSTTNSKFSSWVTTPKTISPGTLASGTASRCIMTVKLPLSNTTDANQTLNFDAVFNGTDGG